MSNQPPLTAEPPQGLQKTLDTYREITAAACGLLSKIISTTTVSMTIPVDILNEIDAVQCRFREQRRLEYREGVPAGVRSVLEKPSSAETLLNKPLFPELIYSVKPSSVKDDGPVCGDCSHFKPDDDYWGSCHRDRPGSKRGRNMLVSHAVDSRRSAFSPCLDFNPKEKPVEPKPNRSLADEILKQAQSWADEASMLQADAGRYQDVCDTLEEHGFPVDHERGQDAHEVIDQLLRRDKPKGDEQSNMNPAQQTDPDQVWAVISIEEADHEVWAHLVRAFTGSGAETAANTLCQELVEKEKSSRGRWYELYEKAFGHAYYCTGSATQEQRDEFNRLLRAENLRDFPSRSSYRVEHATLSHITEI